MTPQFYWRKKQNGLPISEELSLILKMQNDYWSYFIEVWALQDFLKTGFLDTARSAGKQLYVYASCAFITLKYANIIDTTFPLGHESSDSWERLVAKKLFSKDDHYTNICLSSLLQIIMAYLTSLLSSALKTGKQVQDSHSSPSSSLCRHISVYLTDQLFHLGAHRLQTKLWCFLPCDLCKINHSKCQADIGQQTILSLSKVSIRFRE